MFPKYFFVIISILLLPSGAFAQPRVGDYLKYSFNAIGSSTLEYMLHEMVQDSSGMQLRVGSTLTTPRDFHSSRFPIRFPHGNDLSAPVVPTDFKTFRDDSELRTYCRESKGNMERMQKYLTCHIHQYGREFWLRAGSYISLVEYRGEEDSLILEREANFGN